MPITWDTRRMTARLGEDRCKVITTHPEGRYGPSAGHKWHSVTERLVDLSLRCGFNEISERNALDVARRLATYQKKFGAALAVVVGATKEDIEIHLTIEDVWNHVGLSTNGGPMTVTEFKEHFGELADPIFGESAHDKYEGFFADELEAA